MGEMKRAEAREAAARAKEAALRAAGPLLAVTMRFELTWGAWRATWMQNGTELRARYYADPGRLRLAAMRGNATPEEFTRLETGIRDGGGYCELRLTPEQFYRLCRPGTR